MDDRHRKLLAAALRENAAALSRALYDAVRDEACATWKVPQTFEQVEEWGHSQLLTTIDLLAAWFETGDPLLRELFAGWVQSRMTRDLSEEGAPTEYQPDKALAFTKMAWTKILEPSVPPEAIAALATDLDQAASVLSKPSLKKPRILFIGDCIQFEAIAALAGPCVGAQIRFDSLILNEKVQPVLRNRIRAFRPDEFDLVFFSPFSHSYLPDYEVLLNPRSRFWSTAKMQGHVDLMLKEVGSTADTLANQLQCPIYLHNTAGTIQSFSRVSGLAKNLLSRRNRTRARDLINQGIARYLSDPRLESRVRLLDEDGLRAQQTDWQLGQTYLNSHAFHPTRLGVAVGRSLYFEAVYASTFLASKKVVVCDLDNTLWDGVIGEGAVTHYLDRQATLKELRRRGVLLSINSKNDPKNVHWAGAALQAEDFVAPRINWNLKVANMAAIRDELNLKLKDFIFLDDRPDELERMRNAYPEILALNATDAATWNLLAHWQRSLPSEPDEDRTRQYHQRVQREQFVSELSTVVEDETAALQALELSVKIVEASRSGLKRAAELVNRTNQFNLCGSRTTVRELEDGMGVSHSVITVEAADKFGSMGVVGVMRVDWKPEGVEIPIFVLSCRVFGFGIEYALLNSVKRLVRGDHTLVGLYRETQYNEPCRQLYPASRMQWDGKRWIGRIADLPADPVWLKIENGVAAKDWAAREKAAPTH
ncbi:MAG TPA: HAD-IIIC family phosphatase [Bryobacteraceae bacterium]|jgi:FkbH-like protein|nr:HAD-IIIC family phosphatase [Bryobacteraceae bacterium]